MKQATLFLISFLTIFVNGKQTQSPAYKDTHRIYRIFSQNRRWLGGF